MKFSKSLQSSPLLILVVLLLSCPSALRAEAWWVILQERSPRQITGTTDQVELSERCQSRRSLRSKLAQHGDWDRLLDQGAVQQVLATGAQLRQQSRWLNALSVEASADQLQQIRQLSVVRELRPVAHGTRIEPESGPVASESSRDLSYGPSLDQLDEIDVIRVHNAGLSGTDVIVLMLDTGFLKDHEAVHTEQVIAEWDFINDDGNTQNEGADVSSQHNHGTLTWSTLGGSFPGQLYGPAYGASFLLAKTEDVTSETPIEEDNYIAALEWGEALGADVSSGSLGYIDWYTFEDLNGLTAPISIAVDQAVALGMVCCVSAGNSRSDSWGHINTPTDAFNCISVGAVDANNVITWFSSPGPTFDGRIKPEVTARGLSTVCAGTDSLNHYRTASGTSLSCPLVGGGVALIVQAHPQWTPAEVREALLQTADNSLTPNNDVGWGRVSIGAAIEYSSPAQSLTIVRQGADVHLAWQGGVAGSWKVYTSSQPFGPFDTLLIETMERQVLHADALLQGQLFYQVRANGTVLP